MRTYSLRLILLLIHCILFSIIGGVLFSVLGDTSLGCIPYIASFGLGAGWQITRPMSMVVIGSNGIIFTAFFFAVRAALALLIGWIILIPYAGYLVVQAIRN